MGPRGAGVKRGGGIAGIASAARVSATHHTLRGEVRGGAGTLAGVTLRGKSQIGGVGSSRCGVVLVRNLRAGAAADCAGVERGAVIPALVPLGGPRPANLRSIWVYGSKIW